MHDAVLTLSAGSLSVGRSLRLLAEIASRTGWQTGSLPAFPGIGKPAPFGRDVAQRQPCQLGGRVVAMEVITLLAPTEN